MSTTLETCPQCRTAIKDQHKFTLTRVSNMCGHILCLDCFNRMEAGNVYHCVICQEAFSKKDLKARTFDDGGIDRDVEVRSSVLRIHNMREKDFATLAEYNDYLEMVEDVVFDLTMNPDRAARAAARAALESFARENRDQIERRARKLRSEHNAQQQSLAATGAGATRQQQLGNATRRPTVLPLPVDKTKRVTGYQQEQPSMRDENVKLSAAEWQAARPGGFSSESYARLAKSAALAGLVGSRSQRS